MEKEIVNRVANSKLITFDLEDFYPKGERISFDISKWLYEGVVLKEKDFRAFVSTHDWSQYTDTFVALHCSTEAVGSLEELETVLFSEIIHELPLELYRDKPVIIKGCSHKTIPSTAYVLLAQRLQPIAKSILYGEACSSVPLYKKK